jgi:hypothetical protein
MVGDIHSEWFYLNELVGQNPDLIICCGDFGYWPRYFGPNGIAHPKDGIKNGNIKILFCDGNHEDHEALRLLEDTEIAPNVFYMPRGSTYKLQDGRTILFMGGANSIDKDMRTLGVDYFREETISYADLQNLPDEDIDIVVSHTCPDELTEDMIKRSYYGFSDNDPSRKALSYLLKKYNPSFWYFGHWHFYVDGVLLNGTKFFCLSDPGMERGKWWVELSS